jgi:cob(I)alamin adenosyltransferase
MAFKIYTKTGDKGTTGLYGGERREKDDIRIEAYGTVDELNSFIGLVRDSTTNEVWKERLTGIQEVLFDIGSHLAAQPGKKLQLPELDESLVKRLEDLIDELDETLPPLRAFILPGGEISISYTHLARTVCRRAERRVISLSRLEETHPIIIPFLNRLSDFLFTFSRYLAKELNIKEIEWTAGRNRFL